MFNVQVTSTTMKLLPVVCLCLVTRCGMTSAAEKGPAVVKVEQDRDVILPCSLSTKENIELKLFDWKKAAQKDEKQKEVFFYDAGVHYNNGRSGQSEQFKGRVFHFPEELKHGNASIIIRNTKMADSGDYTCVFPRLDPRQTFHIKLVVGAAPKPSIAVLDQTKDRALLWCEANGNPEPEVEWRDSAGNILPAQKSQVSERDGRFYITLNTTVTKTDRYRCVATQKEINHQIYFETFVHMNGAAPEPSVTILEMTKDWSRLQCVVRGASPKPKVEWKDGSGNKLPAEEPQVTDRGGSYDIILQTTVTKTDYYHCVVTQEEINHQTEAKIHVYISGAATEPSVTILEYTKDWSRLQCVVRGASPKPKVEWKDSSGNKLPAEEPQVTDRGGSYDIILQTTVTKTDYYHCVVTQEEINHQTEAKIHVYIGGSTGWVGIVAGVFTTLFVVGVILLAVLLCKGYLTLNYKKDNEKRKPLNDSVSQSEQLQPPQTSPVI